jgi:hypothetical protein
VVKNQDLKYPSALETVKRGGGAIVINPSVIPGRSEKVLPFQGLFELY